ncbi:MAG TPA: hypothetical protein VLK56_05185 [Solirubrobacterales bacterium]|nr:hypothetical protein [Solirubrobacterales bacterium]
MTEFAIAAAPLLLLVVALLLGHYPGCDAAMRLAARIASRARPRATVASNSPRPRLPASHAAHGGQVIAFGLAQRPPPLAA